MRIVLTWLCLAYACSAGWDTNIWPSWTVQREGKAQMQEAYSSVWERCAFASDSLPTSPAWYRSQRANLNYLKTALKGTIENSDWLAISTDEAYVSPTVFGVVYTNLVTDYTSYTQTVSLTMRTVTNVLITSKLPTNYFDYTPWRCLNENGPFTNDATVQGRGHGWTNASTAAGGTNFPSSRTTWYTTDYGLEGIRCVTNLIAIQETPVFSAPDAANKRYGLRAYASMSGTWPGIWTNTAPYHAQWYAHGAFTNAMSTNSLDSLTVSYYLNKVVATIYQPGFQIAREYKIARHDNTNGISRKVMAFAWGPDQSEYEIARAGVDTIHLDFNTDANATGQGFTHEWNVLGVSAGYTNNASVWTGPFGNTNLGANGSATATAYIPNIPINYPADSDFNPDDTIRGYNLGGIFPTVKIIEADFTYK